MKKSTSLFLVVAMIFALMPFSAFGVFADTVTDAADITYTLSDDGTYYIVSGCNKDIVEAVIPAEYEGLPVKEIGDEVFWPCNYLTSVELPNSITVIGENAFSGCDITSIEIPNSVTTIGDSAFGGCNKLTSIEIPDSVTYMGINPFQQCYGLETITVSSGNEYYHSSNNCLIETESKILVSGCMNSIIPDDGSVTVVGNRAFQICKNLTSIEIPDSVTTIGELAFYGCESLASIEIPDSVTIIGERAFYECESMTSVVISNSLEIIDSGVFYHCKGLTSIEIPDSVTAIYAMAFFACSNLVSIEIPDSVTFIGEMAFFNCNGLISVVIPNSVTTIDPGTFHGFTKAIDDIYCNVEERPDGWDEKWCLNTIQVHWHNCDCGEAHPDAIMHDDGEWATADEADIHKEGKKECRCTVCGFLLDTAVIPEKHQYGNVLKYDEHNHWQECVCGDKADVSPHDDEWITVEEAEVNKEGKKECRCTVCGYVLETEAIPALPMLGDVNGNGEIDMMDYVLLKRAYFGTFKLDANATKRADVHFDGEIDIMDYVLLKRAYFGTYTISN